MTSVPVVQIASVDKHVKDIQDVALSDYFPNLRAPLALVGYLSDIYGTYVVASS